MTETVDREGLSDLSKDRAEWWQINSDDQQKRTGSRAGLPDQHWVAPGRSDTHATTLVVNDGVGNKMATISSHDHGSATPTAIGRSLPQSCAATLLVSHCCCRCNHVCSSMPRLIRDLQRTKLHILNLLTNLNTNVQRVWRHTL